jgi:hypothetical protein
MVEKKVNLTFANHCFWVRSFQMDTQLSKNIERPICSSSLILHG